MKRACALIIAMFGAVPAIGQTGSIIDHRPAAMPVDRELQDIDNRKLMYDFATCAVRRWKSGVERYLAIPSATGEAQRFVQRLITEKCLLGGQISFREPAFRAAAYDVMYRLRYAKAAPADVSTAPMIDYGKEARDAVWGDTKVALLLRQFADCAVRKGPEQARQLILSSVGSAAELAAFQAITPSVSACMSNDVTLKFSKWTLRGSIGEALYRLSAAAGARANEAAGG